MINFWNLSGDDIPNEYRFPVRSHEEIHIEGGVKTMRAGGVLRYRVGEVYSYSNNSYGKDERQPVGKCELVDIRQEPASYAQFAKEGFVSATAWQNYWYNRYGRRKPRYQLEKNPMTWVLVVKRTD